MRPCRSCRPVKYWYRCTRWREPAGQLSARWLSTAAPGVAARGPLSLDPRDRSPGVVVARADDVREVAVGDEVYAMARFPGRGGRGSRAYAEQYVSVPVSDLARKPLTLEPSAGCRGADVAPDRLAVLRSIPGMRWRIRCSRGRIGRCRWRVNASLVNGAAGEFGHFAVQLAKWQGAEVIAVAAGRHEAFYVQLGADSVIDYTTTAVEETVRDLDLVIDAWAGRPAAVFAYPATRRRAVPDLSASALPGGRGATSAE